MKAARLILCWWTCCTIDGASATVEAPFGESETPETTWANVTLPYAELKSLWEAERAAPEPSPPVDGMILSAEYDLALRRDGASMTVRYRAESLSDGWRMFPLLGGDPRLLEPTAKILWRERRYHLLTHGKGESRLELQFAISDPATWTQGAGLHLAAAAASVNRLRVTGIPEGKAFRAGGLTPTATSDGSVTYHLPASGCDLEMWLEPDEQLGPAVASTWDIQSEALVSYREGRLSYEAHTYARANDGSGLTMVLILPRNALEVTLEGEDLLSWRLGRRKEGSRRLRIEWRTRDVLDRKLRLAYRTPQSPLSSAWVLHAPKTSGEGTTHCLFVLPKVTGLQLAGPGLNESIHTRRLPGWLRESLDGTGFLTVDTGAEYKVQTTWLPQVETAQATIRCASYSSRVVADGALLVSGEYTIEHRAPLSWRLALPAVDEILTCEVQGRAVQPVKRGDREIEFALTTPAEQGATKVAFSYAARVAALDPVSGRIAIELPRTDLFIDALEWSLSIPETYETTAIHGNVAIAPALRIDPAGKEDPHRIIRLKKDLLRGEHPSVEIYYRKRGLDR